MPIPFIKVCPVSLSMFLVKKEVESSLEGRLTLVEKALDTQSRQVRVWAELSNPGWLIPGSRATMVVPPQK